MLGFSLPRSRPWRDSAAWVATINGLAWTSHRLLNRCASFQSLASHAALNKQLVVSASVPSPAHRPSSARLPLLTGSP